MEESKTEELTFLIFAPGYSKYRNLFIQNGYDDESFRLLTGDDISELANILKLLPGEKVKFKAKILEFHN